MSVRKKASTVDEDSWNKEKTGRKRMHKGNVLIVHQDAGLKNFRMNFNFKNCNVVFAEDGCEALQIYYQNKRNLNLVFSSLIMTHMDGFEFISRFRRISSVPLYLLSEGTYIDEKVQQFIDKLNCKIGRAHV